MRIASSPSCEPDGWRHVPAAGSAAASQQFISELGNLTSGRRIDAPAREDGEKRAASASASRSRRTRMSEAAVVVGAAPGPVPSLGLPRADVLLREQSGDGRAFAEPAGVRGGEQQPAQPGWTGSSRTLTPERRSAWVPLDGTEATSRSLGRGQAIGVRRFKPSEPRRVALAPGVQAQQRPREVNPRISGSWNAANARSSARATRAGCSGPGP